MKQYTAVIVLLLKLQIIENYFLSFSIFEANDNFSPKIVQNRVQIFVNCAYKLCIQSGKKFHVAQCNNKHVKKV